MKRKLLTRRIRVFKRHNTANSSKYKLAIKQKLNQTLASWNLKKITTGIFAVSIVIALVSSVMWYKNLYMTPERRFYAAVQNSMSTPSVVRTLTEGGSGNQVVQQFRFHFAPQRAIQNNVAYTQKSATQDTRVVTEGIIFPESQYLRYTEYVSRNQGQTETNIDELLGEWALEEALTDEEESLTYLSEQVSLVIFGNFPQSVRSDFMNTIKNSGIYQVDFSQAIEEELDGESVLIYPVSVKLKEYAALLNRSFELAGYGSFPALNPDNYREDAEVNAQITIRKRDNTIVGVNFGGRDERYSGYGIVLQVEAPDATRSIEELQDEVQRLFEEQVGGTE